mmetsp:Transcript_41813/g.116616  ORF Transcript_41813/g.116616 Transcript_41813/m.116616 type:complete len:153 (-) Transcript_41813:189-647(-)
MFRNSWREASGDWSLSSSGGAEDPPEEPEPEPEVRYIRELHQETSVPIAELQSLDAQGLLRQIPRDADGKLLSVGSISHIRGECLPCFFVTRKCCSRGISCNYCHVRHERRTKLRPKTLLIRGEHDQRSRAVATSAARLGSSTGVSGTTVSL